MQRGAHGMTEHRYEITDKPHEGEMPDVLMQMQAITRAAAEPWTPGMSIKEAIGRAARRLDISYRRAATFWRAEPCKVLAEEADKLRRWHRKWLADERVRLSARIEQLELEWERLGDQL